MNVADSLGDLTGQLAQLYASRGPGTRDDLDVDAALHGRAAVIALSRELLLWGTHQWHGQRPGLVDMEVDPTRGLVWQLGHHPLPQAGRSPIDVAQAAGPGSPADRWERVATQATLVQTLWGASTDRPTGQHTRTVLADVAVLALSISHLDQRLATSAASSGRADVSAALSGDAVPDLRHSAEATLRHLARGDLPAWRATVRPDHRRAAVLPMRDPSDVPRGLARLTSLLEAGTPVSPAHLHRVIQGQERIAVRLTRQCAALWRATADPAALDTGRRLRGLAASLADAAPALGRDLATLDPSDPRPLLQVNECLRALGFSNPDGFNGLRQRIDLISDQAAVLMCSVEAAGTCARQQVDQRRWLAVQWSEHQSEQTWTRLTRHDHPRIAAVATLSRTALDLLTRSGPLMTASTTQPAMTPAANRRALA